MVELNSLHKRIIEISKKHKLSHLGSTLTSVNIIDEIYGIKKEDEPFILSMGHAGLALYVVNEKYYGIDAEKTFLQHGVHPERCVQCRIECSTGSLGMGLPIALGMALADRSRNVYCLISDGECFEGSIWESATVIRKFGVTNLKIYLNFNGFSAYDMVEPWMLKNMKMLLPAMEVRITDVGDYGLVGLSAHYVTL